jgi:hypothetical protein
MYAPTLMRGPERFTSFDRLSNLTRSFAFVGRWKRGKQYGRGAASESTLFDLTVFNRVYSIMRDGCQGMGVVNMVE